MGRGKEIIMLKNTAKLSVSATSNSPFVSKGMHYNKR